MASDAEYVTRPLQYPHSVCKPASPQFVSAFNATPNPRTSGTQQRFSDTDSRAACLLTETALRIFTASPHHQHKNHAPSTCHYAHIRQNTHAAIDWSNKDEGIHRSNVATNKPGYANASLLNTLQLDPQTTHSRQQASQASYHHTQGICSNHISSWALPTRSSFGKAAKTTTLTASSQRSPTQPTKPVVSNPAKPHH